MAPSQLPAALFAACAVFLTLAVPLIAGDPDMLQDFCVADYKSLKGPLRLNGFPCKRPETVTANDFFSNVLAKPGNTNNPVGSAVTAANVENVPGLNTLGVSMSHRLRAMGQQPAARPPACHRDHLRARGHARPRFVF
uniref:Uncharacterized protein n=1 Tax=Avena sativa TaxID=4498 RepID=A0ACD6AIT2_AVESA